jgi:hypothetical protein
MTDTVALQYNTLDDEYHILCSLEDVLPNERVDAVADVEIFTWFGKAWPLNIGEGVDVRPWP